LFEDIKNHPGVEQIAALVGNHSSNKDQWLVYEKGGRSLSKLLFDVKGEFYKGERIYAVSSHNFSNLKARKQEFYYTLKENPNYMKSFVRKLVQTLDFL